MPTVAPPDLIPALPTFSTPSLTQPEVLALRDHFPVLQQRVHAHKPLVYLDNGATTQKPQCFIDTLHTFYQQQYGTVRRGVYALAEGATTAFDAVREQVTQLLGAAHSDEVVFTHGCTEAINLVAYSFGEAHVQAGDAIVVTAMEHHANFVPWQQLCQRKKAHFLVVPITATGELELEVLHQYFQEYRVKLLAVTHVSNVLGTVNPIAALSNLAHAHGAKLLVDGAQAIPHMQVNVQSLGDAGVDFYTFSPHKLYGPTGLGVLYGKLELLNSLPPYQCGGDMIDIVTAEQTTFLEGHRRFEAGTPPIAEVISFGASLAYVQAIGLERIARYEHELYAYAVEQLHQHVPDIIIHGQQSEKAAVLAFSIPNVHPFDLGTLLDLDGIAIRTGHHCAQPLMHVLGVSHTARAVFSFYNTFAEVDAFVASLKKNVARCL
ncbi:MAG: aminotransferase class V-fold PLP-dependent enzyme [Vampirovibrionales bacterium]